ncbi:MAG: glycerol-3-phosphate cytidylyltransferase-like family protein [Kiritimatiellia bacterium]
MQPEPHNRVYIDMIGDLYHGAHTAQLAFAGSKGDHLVVGVFSDETCAAMGYTVVDGLEQRAAAIAACRHVSEVVLDAPIVPPQDFAVQFNIGAMALADDYGVQGRDLPGRRWDERAVSSERMRAIRAASDPTVDQRLTNVESQLSTVLQQQEAVFEALGCVSAGLFNDPRLLRSKKPKLADWRQAMRDSGGEQLALRTFSHHGPATARPWITRVRDWSSPTMRVTIIGEYAESIAFALAHERKMAIMRPGFSSAISIADDRHLPPGATAPTMTGCRWDELDMAMPPTDVLAITDSLRSTYLLRRRNLLWRVGEEIQDAMLIAVSLSPTSTDLLRSRDDRLYCSDSYVRSALHYVRFMEVVNLSTLVDGIPRTTGPCRHRISRFTRRKGIQHGDKFRYLDDGPTERIKAKSGTSIMRYYLATKRMISEDELAFVRGDRSAP